MSYARPILATCVCIAAFGLTGCDSDDDDNNNNSAPAPAAQKDIVDTAASAGLSTLTTAVNAAELTATLRSPGPFTVFAPTNAAFAALPDGTLDSLLQPANKTTLQDVLKYHVLAGSKLAAQVVASPTQTTVEGSDVIVDQVGGSVYINQAKVTTANVAATNGTVHVIDSVLLPPTDIVATLQARGNFTQLIAAVGTAGLGSVVNGDGPKTLLAPTDAAFAAISSTVSGLTTEQLTNVLKYHLIPGASVKASAAVAAGTAETALGQSVSFTFTEGVAKVNGKRISVINIPATNGIIHVIDEVLIPTPDIVDTAVAAGLSTLTTAVNAAELTATLRSPGPFTVFAPTNAAFAALPAGTLDSLLLPANKATLQDVLNYHVLAGSKLAAQVVASPTQTTVEGSDVIVDQVAGSVYINQAKVTTANVAAGNGTVHVVDSVLLPPTDIVATLQARGNFTQLINAVTTAGLAATVNSNTQKTLLAPTDAAFEAIASTVAGLTTEQLTNILTYHVITAGAFKASAAVTAGAVTSAQGQTLQFSLPGGVPKVNDVTISVINIPCTNGIIHVIDAVLIPPVGISALPKAHMDGLALVR